MPRLPDAYLRALDSNGDPVSGAYLYPQEPGTTTAVTTYSDAAMTTPTTNPIVADASGSFGDVYARAGKIKLRMTTPAGVELPGSPADNVLVSSGDVSAATLAEAATLGVYPQERIEVRGHTTEGDDGGGWYQYAASEPSHEGKFQDSGGYWFELGEAELRPEQFGAVTADGTTDEAAELLDAIEAAIALDRPLKFFRLHAAHSDLEIAARVALHGVSSASTGIAFFGGKTLRFKNGDGTSSGTTIQKGELRNMRFVDGDDGAAWLTAPLVEIWRASGWSITGCFFGGQDKRSYGLWAGRGWTMWGSTISRNQFTQCQFGVVIGDQGDATHINFLGNTVDHNKVCGAVFCNLHGGTVQGNSFEYNEGKTGVAFLGQANGSSANSYATNVFGNYIYNNCIDYPGDADANGVLVGYDIPDSSFTSATGCWGVYIFGNYIVSDQQLRAIKANIRNDGEVRGNTVGGYSGESYDITLTGDYTLIEVNGNKNQGLTAFDRVETADGTWGRQVQVAGTTSVLPAETAFYWGSAGTPQAQMTHNQHVFGTDDHNQVSRRFAIVTAAPAATATTMFDIAAELPNGATTGVYFIKGFIWQSDEDNAQSFEIQVLTDTKDNVGATVAAAVYDPNHNPTLRDSRTWTFSGTNLQFTSTNAATLSAEVLAVRAVAYS